MKLCLTNKNIVSIKPVGKKAIKNTSRFKSVFIFHKLYDFFNVFI